MAFLSALTPRPGLLHSFCRCQANPKKNVNVVSLLREFSPLWFTLHEVPTAHVQFFFFTEFKKCKQKRLFFDQVLYNFCRCQANPEKNVNVVSLLYIQSH